MKSNSRFRLSYVPLIAPATSDARMQVLCQIADSFIYVVSRMGVTGISESLNTGLPALMERVYKYAGEIPAVVGFGISRRDEFLSIGKIANGIVIGSQIIKILAEAPTGEGSALVTEYCLSITGKEFQKDNQERLTSNRSKSLVEPEGSANTQDMFQNSTNMSRSGNSKMEKNNDYADGITASVPSRFGEFGGQYVPESLMDCLTELEAGFFQTIDDPNFWKEYQSYYPYIGRPSSLHPADRLSGENGGARLWLKREDLNHTGSHKINNALGQILLARRLGKRSIIAETGAGQHGVATATVCAKFGLKCTIYMGAEDIRRQSLNVFRIKLLGAEVIPVDNGTKTLRDAVNEALRSWVTNLSTTHYIIGSAIGPHPFPMIVRTFQSVIGNETKKQFLDAVGKNPDAVVACVGGGSNAAGMFFPFSKDFDVKLVGIEAGGDGIKGGKHAAPLSKGTKGVLHGVRTYVLQDSHGQILDTQSVSAGLDYPGVGPELSSWKDSNRAEFTIATDVEALAGFRALSQYEGIIPALETAHAIYGAMELAKKMRQDQNIVVCLSGRGDKDISSVAEELPRLGPKIHWDLRRKKLSKKIFMFFTKFFNSLGFQYIYSNIKETIIKINSLIQVIPTNYKIIYRKEFKNTISYINKILKYNIYK